MQSCIREHVFRLEAATLFIIWSIYIGGADRHMLKLRVRVLYKSDQYLYQIELYSNVRHPRRYYGMFQSIQ